MFDARLTMLALAAALGVSAGVAVSKPKDEYQLAAERGRYLVQRNCVGCHNVGVDGLSPNANAPPFRLLGGKHTAESLRFVAAQSSAGDHYGMPSIYLSIKDARDIAVFIDAFTSAQGKARKKLSVAPCATPTC